MKEGKGDALHSERDRENDAIIDDVCVCVCVCVSWTGMLAVWCVRVCVKDRNASSGVCVCVCRGQECWQYGPFILVHVPRAGDRETKTSGSGCGCRERQREAERERVSERVRDRGRRRVAVGVVLTSGCTNPAIGGPSQAASRLT